MKRLLHLLTALTLACLVTPSDASAQDKKLPLAIAVDAETRPATNFAPDTAKLYCFWLGQGVLKSGDKVRGVWIAEDVGSVAPANAKIDEATVTIPNDGNNGSFSLSKPTAGWPVGQYRVQVYIGDQLAGTAKFSIGSTDKPAKADSPKRKGKAKDKDKDEDEDDE